MQNPAHPLAPLVDAILDRAVRDGIMTGMPSIEAVLGSHRGTDADAADGVVGPDRALFSVICLSDLIETAERDLSRLRGPGSRAARLTEIADLRMRLAAEVQAIRPRRQD
jgi:hypothetical protein